MINKILLVDDKPANLLVFEEILSTLNVECLQSTSGKDALLILEEHDISLLLLDVQMPGMNGFETLKIIKKNDKWKNIPVILISAVYKNESYQIKGIKLGAIEFITKPVIPQLLLSKIQIYLELYEYRRKQNNRIEEISFQLESLVQKRTHELEFKNKQLRIEKKERKAAVDIINASPLIAFRWKNTDGLPLEYVSENVKRISGYTVNELISGKIKIFDIIHKEDIERVSNELVSFTQEKDKTTFAHKPYRINVKDGRILWVEEWIIIIRNKEGYITHFQGIILDITDKINTSKELEVAKEKAIESDRLKTAFLANMSHEIRTPMNAILGFSQLLALPDITKDESISYVDTIANSGKQLLNLIDDIISISQIEAGIIEVYRKNTSPEEILKTSHKLFLITAEKTNLAFTYKNELPKEYQTIYTDPRRIQQVLVNLISNAFKFTSNGTIEIGCRLNNNNIEFYVSDTGIGISKEDQKMIFGRFMQVDHGTNVIYGGTGIGLSISKAIVEKLGGNIWAISNKNQGTTFCFTLPIIHYDDKIGSNQTKVEIANPNLHGKTFLIAEDEDDNFELINILLTKSGAKIIRAINGKEAINIIKKNDDIDLVFMDVKMPVMNGLEATTKVREFNKIIPIIAQTAYAQTGDRETTLKAGCNDYISKPILKNVLFELIKKYI
ncbi:MAG: response regulator [Bacteroidota bacterium]